MDSANSFLELTSRTLALDLIEISPNWWFRHFHPNICKLQCLSSHLHGEVLPHVQENCLVWSVLAKWGPPYWIDHRCRVAKQCAKPTVLLVSRDKEQGQPKTFFNKSLYWVRSRAIRILVTIATAHMEEEEYKEYLITEDEMAPFVGIISQKCLKFKARKTFLTK